MALTRKLTKSLTRSLTRKLTGAELQQLFLEKFKLTLSNTELVTNGTFDTDSSNWTTGTGWTVGSGVATHTGSSAGYLQPSATLVAGKSYSINLEITSFTDGFLQVYGSSYSGIAFSSVGQHSMTFVADNTYVRFRSTGTMSVDNISVKEITKQAPVAAFSLRKLGDVSPYAARIRRSSDNTEAQVMFDASDRVSESSVVRNTSQNLLSYSEDFGEWSLGNSPERIGGLADPYGGNNAWSIRSASGGAYHHINHVGAGTISITPNSTYTFSWYVKKETSKTNFGGVGINLFGGTSKWGYIIVDEVNGTAVDSSASGIGSPHIEVTEPITGWWRVAVTVTDSHSNNSAQVLLYSGFSSNGSDLAPVAGSARTIFGTQLEETVTYESTNGTEKLTNGTFDTTDNWTVQSHWAVSGGVANYNDTGNSALYQSVSIKAGFSYRLRFDISNASTTARLWIGNLAGTNAYVAGGYQSLSNGSYDYTFTVSQDESELKFFGHTDGGTFSLDNVSVLEFDPIPSEYISTPTVSNDGLTFTESTLDAFVGGENLLTRSENFTNGSWNHVGGTQSVVENHTNHLGESTASLITTTATGARIERAVSIVSGQSYVASVWAKRYTSSRIEMKILLGGSPQSGSQYATQGLIRANISSSDGSLSTDEAGSLNHSEVTYTDFGGGWYRASFKFTASGSDTSAVFRLKADTVDGDKGTYFFGAQLNTDSLKDYQKTVDAARDGNAGVVVLYNQTGGEDATQATSGNQPLLYKGGLLVSSGTSPAMEFDGTNDYLPFSSDFNDDLNLNSLSASVVFQTDYPTQTAGILLFLGGSTGGNKRWYQPFINGSKFKYSYGTNHPATEETANTDHNIVTFVAGASGTSGLQVYRNGTHVNNHTATLIPNSNDTDPAGIGAYGQGSLHYKGKFQEAIIFDSDQKSNREAIESDIATAHNITLS